MSLMADLMIWSLTRAFTHLIEHKCSIKPTKHSDDFAEYGKPLDPDSELLNKDWFNDTYIELKDWFRKGATLPVVKILYSFTLESPVVSNPPKINEIAINCAPSIAAPSPWKENLVKVNVFSNGTSDKLNVNWVHLNIIELLENDCAGWHIFSRRDPSRYDDKHRFTPTMYTGCPSGALHPHVCPAPNWSRSQGIFQFHLLSFHIKLIYF